MDPVLELLDVEKHFYLHEREKHLLAFEAINFSVDEGALLAITGPSGVGKSSILKCIYRSYLGLPEKGIAEKSSSFPVWIRFLYL